MSELNKISILEAASGAIKERMDYELAKIIDNILDPNTRADKKRTLTVTLELLPDAERKQISLSTVVKSKLEPTAAISASFAIGADEDGEITVFEMLAQLPGQRDVFGNEQEPAKALRLVR